MSDRSTLVDVEVIFQTAILGLSLSFRTTLYSTNDTDRLQYHTHQVPMLPVHHIYQHRPLYLGSKYCIPSSQ